MGSCIRCDTSIVGFKDLKWIRGNISIVFTGQAPGGKPGKLVLINHDTKKIEYVTDNLEEKPDEVVSKEVHESLCRTIVRGDFKTDSVEVIPNSSKEQKIGDWNCKPFELSGLKYITLHRSDSTAPDKQTPRAPRKEGPALDFDEYFYGEVPPGKGIGLIYASERFRKKTRNFKSKMWLTKEFPVTIPKIIPLLEVLSPTAKHFNKLQQVLSICFPENSFPVQTEIPVFPTVVATVTFVKFEKRESTDDAIFRIPKDYQQVNVHLMDFFLPEE